MYLMSSMHSTGDYTEIIKSYRYIITFKFTKCILLVTVTEALRTKILKEEREI